MDRSARHRVSAARGITMVELLTVMATFTVCAAMAGMSLGRSRRTSVPFYARALRGLAAEAQHAAMSGGAATRLRLTPGTPAATLFPEVRDTTAPGGWRSLGTTLPAPSGVTLCTIEAATRLTAATPACPATTEHSICFSPVGRVSVSTNASCPGATAGTGATLYLSSSDGQARHKLVLFGLTGHARLIDTW